MIPYYFLFSLPALLSLFQKKFTRDQSYILYIFTLIVLIFFVGFRDKVGGDWHIYLKSYNTDGNNPLFLFHTYTSVAYYFLLKIFYQLGLNFYFFNFFLSLIFFFCLHNFIKDEPNPFLCIVIAIPIIILVAVMGYIRQGMALGFILISYKYLIEDRKVFFIFLTILGSFFHVSALFNFIFLIIFIDKLKFKTIILYVLLIVFVIFFYNLESEEINRLLYNYMGKGVYFDSQGAKIRYVINFLPSLIFLAYARKFSRNILEKRLFWTISAISIFLIFFITSYSTSVDRLIIYLNSIQIIVFNRLPYLFNNNFNSLILTLIILIFYFVLYYAFLNISIHGPSGWMPYRTILF